jgi:hypothetical protein
MAGAESLRGRRLAREPPHAAVETGQPIGKAQREIHEQITTVSQRSPIQREESVPDSDSAIARSKRLLERIDRLVARLGQTTTAELA